jgi:hypothetical protein
MRQRVLGIAWEGRSGPMPTQPDQPIAFLRAARAVLDAILVALSARPGWNPCPTYVSQTDHRLIGIEDSVRMDTLGWSRPCRARFLYSHRGCLLGR